MSIFKQIKAAFGGSKSKKPDSASELSADSRRLIVIWPDGTWQGRDAGWSMDNTIRGIIFDVWASQEYDRACKLAGRPLNPGMFSAGTLPSDWYPSERALKSMFVKNRWDVAVMHGVVGQLTHLKHIRP